MRKYTILTTAGTTECSYATSLTIVMNRSDGGIRALHFEYGDSGKRLVHAVPAHIAAIFEEDVGNDYPQALLKEELGGDEPTRRVMVDSLREAPESEVELSSDE